MGADDRDRGGLVGLFDRIYMTAETVVYAFVGLALVVGAVALLGETFLEFVTHVDDGVVLAVTQLLASLLLVFVLIELLGAVRATIRERRLVAEPFLLVGIIATIKEIVVIAGAERESRREFAEFRDAMVEIGVLAGVLLVLAIAALLLRRREREPQETSE